MSTVTSKRNLLHGRLSSELPVRPPWSLQESEFIELCTRCNECADECPLHVIKKGSGGFPEMDFSNAGCDFCQTCVDVCKPAALSINQNNEAFNLTATINDECFSKRGVICRSCGEVCESRAIRFKLVVGGVSQLVMDTELCNGCGECVSICPVNSISMKHKN